MRRTYRLRPHRTSPCLDPPAAARYHPHRDSTWIKGISHNETQSMCLVAWSGSQLTCSRRSALRSVRLNAINMHQRAFHFLAVSQQTQARACTPITAALTRLRGIPLQLASATAAAACDGVETFAPATGHLPPSMQQQAGMSPLPGGR